MLRTSPHWFAQVLQRWLTSHKATQRQLAAHLGVDEERVSTWLSGSWPRPDKIEGYLIKLGVDIQQVIHAQGRAPRPDDPHEHLIAEVMGLRERVVKLEGHLAAIRMITMQLDSFDHPELTSPNQHGH